MEKIPTIGELFKKYSWTAKLDGETLKVVDKEDFKKAIIECTKLHVEAALKAAEYLMEEYDLSVEIKNCYPLENIK